MKKCIPILCNCFIMLLNSISEHLFFKIFLGVIPQDPPSINMLHMLIVLHTIGPVHSYTTFSKFCRWSYFPHVYSSCLNDFPDRCKIAPSTLTNTMYEASYITDSCNTFTPEIKGKCHCRNVLLHWLWNVNMIHALITVCISC